MLSYGLEQGVFLKKTIKEKKSVEKKSEVFAVTISIWATFDFQFQVGKSAL
jgi:hypothetical protein